MGGRSEKTNKKEKNEREIKGETNQESGSEDEILKFDYEYNYLAPKVFQIQ